MTAPLVSEKYASFQAAVRAFSPSIESAQASKILPRWTPGVARRFEAVRRHAHLRMILAQTAPQQALSLPIANCAISSDRGLPTALVLGVTSDATTSFVTPAHFFSFAGEPVRSPTSLSP
jgi:hypothetical protein